VIGVPGNVRVYLACGVTDMRKGFDGLAARVQTVLQLDPHGGALFVFRGRRGDLLKVLWWDGQGLPIRQAIGARPVPPMAFVNGFGRA
jgi:transposase